MILTIDNIKEYLPLNSITDGSKYEPFEIRAFFKYLPKYLGEEVVEQLYEGLLLVSDGGSDVVIYPESEIYESLLLKLKPVLANLTILESIPQFNLVATGSGFGIVSNPNQAPASMERVRDLKDSCLQAANDGLDRLLYYLEQNVATYSSWNKSCINTGSLIPSASVFDQFIDISCSRRRFVDLKRHINFEELTTFTNVFSAEFLTELRDGNDIAVKPLIQQALALKAEIHFQASVDPVGDHSFLLNKYLTALSVALSYLRNNLDTYTTYADNAYEAPFDNATATDDDGDAYGFFIGGITG